MTSKYQVVVLLFVVLAATLHICSAAPKPSNKELLEHSIAEYLRHDQQLVQELKQLGFDDAALQNADRPKRQSGFEIEMNNDDVNDQNKQPGFFDRAAKFVVEVLQRFLRWINTENS
ncbi:uncharacterized protein LOC143198826 [Rhynchophorus ferrugineus]|uniref:Uncharacterized protein n=1 Tax=Rhynchophorus ferrugineus TaxID=354439 RepID=A0A834HTL2_RHYFE|nr:hypothetical protein GWI33_019536 [Rhynchophorus ferrugineus]